MNTTEQISIDAAIAIIKTLEAELAALRQMLAIKRLESDELRAMLAAICKAKDEA
jgi:hypothetical protein